MNVTAEHAIVRFPKDWIHGDIRIALEGESGEWVDEKPLQGRSVTWRGNRTVCMAQPISFFTGSTVYRGIVTEDGTPIGVITFSWPTRGQINLEFKTGVFSASPQP